MNTVAPHVTMTKLFYFVGLVYVNKPWFDRLPKDVQTVLREVALEVERELRAWNGQNLQRLDKAWTDSGGTISSLPEDGQKEFSARASKATQAVLADKPELKSFYDSLVAVADKHR